MSAAAARFTFLHIFRAVFLNDLPAAGYILPNNLKNMKYLIQFVCASLLALPVFSQPARIQPITREMRPVEWYAEQSGLWLKETEKNPKNGEAWFNYYRATRYQLLFSGSPGIREKQREIIDRVKKELPESFEYNLLEWLSGWNDLSKKAFLDKATALRPDDPEVVVAQLTLAEVTGDAAGRKKYNQKMMHNGQVAESILKYSYNMLMSVEQNGVLLTGGDNDTYPAWLLQDVRAIRTDVTVINVPLLQIDSYRDYSFKRIGAEVPARLPEKSSAEYSSVLLRSILANKQQRPVHFAVSLGHEAAAPFENDLYLTGLASRYSKEKIDNIALLRKNVEKNFLVDELRQQLSDDPSQTVMDLMCQNYLVPFLSLYNHYKTSGDLAAMEKTETLIMNIARRSGREKEIRPLLEKE